jgi:hypothetical protein
MDLALELEPLELPSQARAMVWQGQWCRRFDTPILSNGLDVVVLAP